MMQLIRPCNKTIYKNENSSDIPFYSFTMIINVSMNITGREDERRAWLHDMFDGEDEPKKG